MIIDKKETSKERDTYSFNYKDTYLITGNDSELVEAFAYNYFKHCTDKLMVDNTLSKYRYELRHTSNYKEGIKLSDITRLLNPYKNTNKKVMKVFIGEPHFITLLEDLKYRYKDTPLVPKVSTPGFTIMVNKGEHDHDMMERYDNMNIPYISIVVGNSSDELKDVVKLTRMMEYILDNAKNTSDGEYSKYDLLYKLNNDSMSDDDWSSMVRYGMIESEFYIRRMKEWVGL